MRTSTTRAGRYVGQLTGYQAFIPAGLPPSPPIVRDPEMDELHFEATLALGKLDGAAEMLPNPDLFVFMYVRKEAVLSSQIEGTQASLMDVLEFETAKLRPGRPQDVAEVVNYVRAMKHGLLRLGDLPVSLRLIKEIHKELLTGVRGGHLTPGEFRTSQNWIGPASGTMSDATFVPPPPHEMLEALADLERFVHDDKPMPALLRVGLRGFVVEGFVHRPPKAKHAVIEGHAESVIGVLEG